MTLYGVTSQHILSYYNNLGYYNNFASMDCRGIRSRMRVIVLSMVLSGLQLYVPLLFGTSLTLGLVARHVTRDTDTDTPHDT